MKNMIRNILLVSIGLVSFSPIGLMAREYVKETVITEKFTKQEDTESRTNTERFTQLQNKTGEELLILYMIKNTRPEGLGKKGRDRKKDKKRKGTKVGVAKSQGEGSFGMAGPGGVRKGSRKGGPRMLMSGCMLNFFLLKVDGSVDISLFDQKVIKKSGEQSGGLFGLFGGDEQVLKELEFKKELVGLKVYKHKDVSAEKLSKLMSVRMGDDVSELNGKVKGVFGEPLVERVKFSADKFYLIRKEGEKYSIQEGGDYSEEYEDSKEYRKAKRDFRRAQSLISKRMFSKFTGRRLGGDPGTWGPPSGKKESVEQVPQPSTGQMLGSDTSTWSSEEEPADADKVIKPVEEPEEILQPAVGQMLGSDSSTWSPVSVNTEEEE